MSHRFGSNWEAASAWTVCVRECVRVCTLCFSVVILIWGLCQLLQGWLSLNKSEFVVMRRTSATSQHVAACWFCLDLKYYPGSGITSYNSFYPVCLVEVCLFVSTFFFYSYILMSLMLMPIIWCDPLAISTSYKATGIVEFPLELGYQPGLDSRSNTVCLRR